MSDETKAPENEPVRIESARDAELRLQSHPDTPLPIKKKTSKRKAVIWIVLVLLFIGIIIGTVFYFIIPTHFTPKVVTDETGYASATHFKSAKDLVTNANLDLAGATVPVTQADGFGGKTADGFGAYSVPTYKVGARKYANLPGASNGVSYKGSSVEAAKNYTALADFFTKNKFKQIASGGDTTGINQWFSEDLKYISYASYESDNVLCMIWHVDATPTAVKEHVTSLGCADKSSYEAAAKELDQFYTAYTKGESVPAENVVLGMPAGAQGEGDYLNINLYQEDPSQLDTQFQGLYYRTKDQKEWTYFTGAYGLLSCTDYNTDTLKKAFKGYSCFVDSNKTYSTVQ